MSQFEKLLPWAGLDSAESPGFAVMNDDKPKKKKRRKTRRLNEADLGLFVKQYGRKARKGFDPNDRDYSREVEKKLKKMRAEDIDRLLRGETEE